MAPSASSASSIRRRSLAAISAALISACGSNELMSAHRQIFDHYLRYQIIAVIYRGEEASSEHRQLLECSLKRDHQTAMAILAQHIRACVEHTVRNGLLPV